MMTKDVSKKALPLQRLSKEGRCFVERKGIKESKQRKL